MRLIGILLLAMVMVANGAAQERSSPARNLPASRPAMDLTRRPPVPIPAHQASDLKSAEWWCDRAEAETRLVASDYDRSHLLYRLAIIRARLGRLEAATKLMEEADALKQPPTIP